MRAGDQLHAPAGWVGRRAGLNGCGKSHPPPGFDPRTVQPVASRYTDYAMHIYRSLRCAMYGGQIRNDIMTGAT